MSEPTMKQAIWIAKQLDEDADNVFDVLTGQITKPTAFVSDVQYWSREYSDRLRRGNERN